jgi:hypothetical protein
MLGVSPGQSRGSGFKIFCFEGGLGYSPNLGILNHSNSSLFSVLEGVNSENGLLVGPEGFEPPTKGL